MSARDFESAGVRTVYRAHLQDDDLSALRRLLGFGVYEIFSSSLQSDRMLLTAPSFSFRLDRDSWVVVRSEWLETPSEWLDYFRLSVRLKDSPDGIEVAADGALIEPSQILLVPAADLVRIEVLSAEDPGEGGVEQVKYDCAIRLIREDGRNFCITAQRSIAEQLHFTEDPTTMARVLEGCAVRLRLE